MSKSINYIICFFLISICLGCSQVKKPFIVNIDSLSIKNYSDSIFELQTNLDIYNPNWFKIHANDFGFKIFLDTNLLAKNFMNQEFELLANDTTSIEAKLLVNKFSLNNFKNFNDSISLKIIAYSNLPVFNKRYFFNIDYNFLPSNEISKLTNSLIDKFSISIAEINIKKVSISSLDLNVKINYQNITGLNINFREINTLIYSDQNFMNLLGSSKLESYGVNLLANQDSSINSILHNISINTRKLASIIITNALQNKHVFYLKINCLIELEGVVFPLIITKKVIYDPKTLESKIL